jgi:hypothetical protein
LGDRPSFVWRSILGAHSVLEHGPVWGIGDGQKIKIWGDRWIPTHSSYAVQTPRRILLEDAKVVELIDPVTKGWNHQLIAEVFREEEARVISSIPLSLLMPQDLLIWRCTTNWLFSIRSACHMEMDFQTLSKGEGSCSRDDEYFGR